MKKHKFQHGSTKTLRYGLASALLSVLVLAAVVLANLVLRALPTKYTEFDISTSALSTLTATTKTLLQGLDTDVTAYYLGESGQEDGNITRLLNRYAGESTHFTWQQRDPVLYPTFAAQYPGASADAVVLVCGDNYEVLNYSGDLYELDLDTYYASGSQVYTFTAENALTGGISRVVQGVSHTVYELTGHGETALAQDFTDTLKNGGITVQTLNLTTAGSVPEDAEALIMNTPLNDLTDAEATLLTDYIQKGGKLFAATDFTADTPKVSAVLALAGLSAQPGLLVETDANHYPYGYPQTYLLPAIASGEVTAGVSGSIMAYTPFAQGILAGDDSNWTYTDVLTTGQTAYAMLNYLTADELQKGENDPEGCFTVAMAAQSSVTDARVVWVNCPNFLSATANQSVSGGNAQVFGSAVNWLIGQENTAVIDGKSLSAESLQVSAGAAAGLGLLFTLGLPIAVLAAGAAVCVVRRRR